MLTFREFYEICEGKKPETPPHAVPGTVNRDASGTLTYTLKPHKGPSGPATKKEIDKLVVSQSGGSKVKKHAKKVAKSIKKIEEQTPTMEPNFYNKLIARQQASRKRSREVHAQQEIGAEARAQERQKRAELRAIMSR